MNDSLQQNLQNNLISQGQNQNQSGRSFYRKRLALGRALTSQKYNNKLLEQSISQMNTHIASLEKKRRQSLLIGIKFKQLLDNVTAAKNMSEFLEQEHTQRKLKQEEEKGRKRHQNFIRRMDVAEWKENSKIVQAEKLQEIKDRHRRDTISFYQDIERSRDNSRQTNREKYERVRSQHQRLKEKMKRIEQFKQKRAQNNYTKKFEQITQRHTLKSVALKQLQDKQKELEQTFILSQRRYKPFSNTTKVMFTTAVTFPEKINHKQ